MAPWDCKTHLLKKVRDNKARRFSLRGSGWLLNNSSIMLCQELFIVIGFFYEYL